MLAVLVLIANPLNGWWMSKENCRKVVAISCRAVSAGGGAALGSLGKAIQFVQEGNRNNLIRPVYITEDYNAQHQINVGASSHRYASAPKSQVSSSSWGLGRAAVCDCDTPWTFLLPFFREYGQFMTLTLNDLI